MTSWDSTLTSFALFQSSDKKHILSLRFQSPLLSNDSLSELGLLCCLYLLPLIESKVKYSVVVDISEPDPCWVRTQSQLFQRTSLRVALATTSLIVSWDEDIRKRQCSSLYCEKLQWLSADQTAVKETGDGWASQLSTLSSAVDNQRLLWISRTGHNRTAVSCGLCLLLVIKRILPLRVETSFQGS